MAWHTFRLSQGGSTLFDFALNNCSVREWASNADPASDALAADQLGLGVQGSSLTNLAANLQALNNALRVAGENERKRKKGQPYTPIFLEVQPSGAANLLQTEVLGGSAQKSGSLLANTLLANYYAVDVTLRRRPYFEEASWTTLVNAGTYSNNFAAIALSAGSLRGDVEFPLYVEVTAGASGNDRLIAWLKGDGSVASYLPVLQTDTGVFSGYAVTLGTAAAFLVDANLANGNGVRITPTDTAEALRLSVTVNANVAANMEYARVWVRARDNGATPRYKLRARFANADGGVSAGYGDWLAYAKSVTVVGGTTALPLLDLGWGKTTPGDVQGQAPGGFVLELWGQQTGSPSYPTFDVDEVILAACDEGGRASGLAVATFPTALSASYHGVVDAGDRTPAAYLVSGAGAFKFPGAGLLGAPLRGHPGQDQRLYVGTVNAAGNLHTQNVNNTVTVKAQFRYRWFRG